MYAHIWAQAPNNIVLANKLVKNRHFKEKLPTNAQGDFLYVVGNTLGFQMELWNRAAKAGNSTFLGWKAKNLSKNGAKTQAHVKNQLN